MGFGYQFSLMQIVEPGETALIPELRSPPMSNGNDNVCFVGCGEE